MKKYLLLFVLIVPLVAFFQNLSPYFSGNTLVTQSPVNEKIVHYKIDARNMSPDGRLAISQMEYDNRGTTYHLNLVRPGNISPDPLLTGLPNLRGLKDLNGVQILVKTESGVIPYEMDATIGGSHLSASFDPTSKKQSAFRCDETGTASFRSHFECYHLVVYMASLQKTAYRAFLKVIVDAFDVNSPVGLKPIRKTDSRIVSAIFENPGFEPQFYRENGAQWPLPSFEVSSTADGRLHVGKTLIGPKTYANFSYNFTENFAADGWSIPQSFDKLHQVQATFRNVAFSSLYPIAKKPFLNNKGEVCSSSQECFPFVYPWISQDGSDLFFTRIEIVQDKDEKSITRAGYSVVGARTNYKVVTLDHAFNRCRLNPVSFSFSPGIMPSMWAQWHEVAENANFPIKKEENVYPIFSISNSQYGEVAMNRFFDTKYLIYLPMNELIENPKYMGSLPAEPGSPDAVNINRSLTPDVASFHTGQLMNGAMFPAEYLRVQKPDWQCDPEGENENIGFKGKGIIFTRNESSLLVRGTQNVENINPAAPLYRFNNSLKSFNIEFAIKFNNEILSSANANKIVDVAFKANSFKIWYKLTEDNILALFLRTKKLDGSSVTSNINAKLLTYDLASWHHISISGTYLISKDQTAIRFYVDGNVVSTHTVDGSYSGFNSDLLLGPTRAQLTAHNYIYILDEFAISNTSRGQDYIANSAGKGVDRSNDFFVPTVVPDAMNLSQKTWLQISDLRIPTQLQAYFTPAEKLHEFGDLSNLGRMLFNDQNLTGQRISCATCHNSSLAFTDGRPLAMGVGGRLGTRNTPTIINRAISTRQFFDNRAKSLFEQSLDPITNPLEMAGDIPTVLRYINSNSTYRPKILQLFGSGTVFNEKHLAKALTAYMLTEISPDSQFDNLFSSNRAINFQQRNQVLRGLQIFNGKGRCVSCHSGVNYSDELRHTIGTLNMAPFSFKTPTLRKLQSTAPYFHDGRAADLMSVIEHYNRGGDPITTLNGSLDPEIRPLGLTTAEKAALLQFLNFIGN